MQTFTRARQGLNLTPGERALLKLLEGFVMAGVVAVLPIVAPALAQQSVNWTLVAHTAMGTFAVAVLLAVAKFYKAQGDAPLAQPLAALATTVASDVANLPGMPNAVKQLAPSSAAPVGETLAELASVAAAPVPA